MYHLNKNIENLERVFDQNNRSGYLRLDLNESPIGLSSEFIEQTLKEVTPEFVAQYPQTADFKEILSDHLGVKPQNLCITNGSAEAIRYIIEAFTSPNGKIVGAAPSYFMFLVYSSMYGREFIKVPYNDDLNMDIKNILTKLDNETQMLILLNPNNPLGNVYSDKEFKILFEACREKQITLLVDEAYHYFYPRTFIKYALENKRVFITRTFSKLFAMAGCRLGYAVGHSDDIKYIQKLCTPHNVNAFSMLFAKKILTTPGILDKLIKEFNESREFLLKELDKHGYKHKGEAGNFIFIQPKSDAQTIVKKMKDEKKILIKSYEKVGNLGDCLRVSIGGGSQIMKKFVEALLELDDNASQNAKFHDRTGDEL